MTYMNALLSSFSVTMFYNNFCIYLSSSNVHLREELQLQWFLYMRNFNKVKENEKMF